MPFLPIIQVVTFHARSILQPQPSYPLYLFVLRVVRIAASILALCALLLEASLLEALAGEHALVLDLELLAVARQLVALFGSRPEVGDGEAVIEVRAKVVHDANGKHDIHAKLYSFFFAPGQRPQQGGHARRRKSAIRTLNTSKFKPPILSREYSLAAMWLSIVEAVATLL